MWLFVSGPMSGLPDYNLPEFYSATVRLRSVGYKVLNPGRRGVIDGYEWTDYMRDAIRDLILCDAVAVLPGWEDSRGSTLEVHIAEGLNMPVAPVDVWIDWKEKGVSTNHTLTAWVESIDRREREK